MIFLLFLFGLAVGSFLNVVIYRSKIKKSIFKPKSFCPHCKHVLAWYDLIPVLSFISLRGRCRYCHKKISLQYPLVELATGILFALFYLQAGGLNGKLFFDLFFTSILIIVFVYDLKHYLILDIIILVGAIGAILSSIFLGKPEFPQSLIGSFVGGGFFALLVLVSSGKWMGGGDVKLSFLIGLILGWPQILLALFIAFMVGSVIGLILIALKNKTLKSAVPFGTFLTASTIITMFFGDEILDWYLGLMGWS